MAVQYSVTVNNARLDAIETAAGASAKLRMYTGAMPANCAAAATGTLLLDAALPASWMAAASAGVLSKSGTWAGIGVGLGNAGYFRITDTAGAITHIPGTCGMGSGDMQLDNTSIAVGQSVTVNSFTITAANT